MTASMTPNGTARSAKTRVVCLKFAKYALSAASRRSAAPSGRSPRGTTPGGTPVAPNETEPGPTAVRGAPHVVQNALVGFSGLPQRVQNMAVMLDITRGFRHVRVTS